MQLIKSLAACVLISLSSADISHAGEVYDHIISSGQIKVATDANWPPQSFLNDNNEMEGFDVDVSHEIAGRMEVQIEFVTPGWDQIISGNWNRRWDLHVGSMTPTRDLAKKLAFPAVYYFTPAVIAVHQDSPLQLISELNGKNIGTSVSTSFEQYLLKSLSLYSAAAPAFSYQINNPKIKPYETALLALDDLRPGTDQTLDGVIASMPEITQAIGEGYPVKIIGDPVFFEPLAIAIDVGDEALGEVINEIVSEMHKDGTLSKLSRKWYGVDYTIAP